MRLRRSDKSGPKMASLYLLKFELSSLTIECAGEKFGRSTLAFSIAALSEIGL